MEKFHYLYLQAKLVLFEIVQNFRVMLTKGGWGGPWLVPEGREPDGRTDLVDLAKGPVTFDLSKHPIV